MLAVLRESALLSDKYCLVRCDVSTRQIDHNIVNLIALVADVGTQQ